MVQATYPCLPTDRNVIVNLIEFMSFRVKGFALGQKVRIRSESLSPTGTLVLVDTLTAATTPSAMSEDTGAAQNSN